MFEVSEGVVSRDLVVAGIEDQVYCLWELYRLGLRVFTHFKASSFPVWSVKLVPFVQSSGFRVQSLELEDWGLGLSMTRLRVQY